jgi:hypothetical protein
LSALSEHSTTPQLVMTDTQPVYRYDITDHYAEDATNVFTKHAATTRTCKDNSWLVLDKESVTEDYLSEAFDEIVRSLRCILTDRAELSPAEERLLYVIGSEEDDRRCLEMRLLWNLSGHNMNKIWGLSFHCRLGNFCMGQERLLPLSVEGDRVDQHERTEHWLQMRRGRATGSLKLQVYHTKIRPAFDAEAMQDSWMLRDKAMLKELIFDIPPTHWNKMFVDPKNWVWPSTQRDHTFDTDTQIVSDEMQVVGSSIRVDNQNMCYYLPMPGKRGSEDESQPFQLAANYIFTHVFNVIAWKNLEGIRESAMEVGIASCCAQVKPTMFFRGC